MFETETNVQDLEARIVQLECENEELKKRLILDDADLSEWFRELQKELHGLSKSKGWWEKDKHPLEVYALIHSEISEAVEEARKGTPPIYAHCFFGDPNGSHGNMMFTPDQPEFDPTQKPEGELIEMADAVIRILDFCEAKGWNLGQAIHLKHQYNKTRPHRHGGKKF